MSGCCGELDRRRTERRPRELLPRRLVEAVSQQKHLQQREQAAERSCTWRTDCCVAAASTSPSAALSASSCRSTHGSSVLKSATSAASASVRDWRASEAVAGEGWRACLRRQPVGTRQHVVRGQQAKTEYSQQLR